MDLKGKKILCTMPGRHGDILWSLPTCRSIAQATGEKVDLVVSEKYKAVLPIARAQEYIAGAAYLSHWEVQETAPMTPAAPPGELQSWTAGPTEPPAPWNKDARAWDIVVNLGYQRWPIQPSLPEEILWNAERQLGVALPDLELHRPWIDSDTISKGDAPELAVCWTDEWAELKMGVLGAVLAAELLGQMDIDLIAKAGSRVITEWTQEYGVVDGPFEYAAKVLNSAALVLSCNSSLWVLAAGLGRPIVMMEPNPDRHNPVFLPMEWAHCMVLGGDNRPTFDARAVVAKVKEALAAPKTFKARKVR